MTQDNGASVPDRATAAEPVVSTLRDGIPSARDDDFRGSTDLLIRSIDAFLDLSDEQAFVPHNIGKSSHAYRLLVSARVRLEASIRSEAAMAVRMINAKAEVSS